MKIDFDHKDSEAGWQKQVDKFWLSVTPKWFEWIGWLLIIGALSYVEQTTSNIAVKIIYIISFLFLWMYFQSFFFQFEFVNLPFFKTHQKTARLISLIISGVLGIGVYSLIFFSVNQFTGK